jgi:hypothetical protein
MNEFAVVSEGVTDYAVLKNILIGWFKDQSGEPFLKPYQPDPTATGESMWQKFGNWENVLRYLKEKKHRDALEFSDYLIVQIDTDQSEHPGFAVPQAEAGVPLGPLVMVQRVKERLKSIIGNDDMVFYEGRILFAICVRELECWLLPLWDDAKAAKCTGCLGALNAALAKANEHTINPAQKDPRRYEEVSREYRKRARLIEKGPKSPSLGDFLSELANRGIKLVDTA